MLLPNDRILEGFCPCPAGTHNFSYMFLTLMFLKNMKMSENASSNSRIAKAPDLYSFHFY